MRSWPYYGEDNSDEEHTPWWARYETSRLELVTAVLVVIALLLLMWAAGAIGTYVTGVPD